jgi:NADH:ubiquinone oxidoreductase subunit E
MKLLKTNKEFEFNSENELKFKKLQTSYPTKRALILPSLWLIQEQDGFISEESILYIANLLELSAMEVLSIASFYVMFKFKPTAKYNIRVCKTLSCELRGAKELIEFLKNYKNENCILDEVECLGHCEVAPTIQLNEEFHKKMDLEKLKKLLSELI